MDAKKLEKAFSDVEQSLEQLQQDVFRSDNYEDQIPVNRITSAKNALEALSKEFDPTIASEMSGKKGKILFLIEGLENNPAFGTLVGATQVAIFAELFKGLVPVLKEDPKKVKGAEFDRLGKR